MVQFRVLLLEPGYLNKYPPLGLMKLAAYHRARGDFVYFAKGIRLPSILDKAWDRVYVTTLFSFEWNRTAATIDFAIRAAQGQPERVFVGGVAASLMHEEYVSVPRWAGVRFIKGLLDRPPAMALQLSANDCEFGADDIDGTPIEELVPDYRILDDIDYTYPVNDAYFGYASRGCIRKCAFCGVPKLEGAQREMPPLTTLVEGIAQTSGIKKDLVLMDNNVVASARYREIIAEIRDLGFARGAVLPRDRKQPVKRRVDFNQGVDARILVKSKMYLREMSSICIDPLRIAFDHIGVRKVYETAIRMAAENEITSLSNYMLYNFMDSPLDLYKRMRLNITLNEQLGIRIWSFPMRYHPINLKDRSHIGRNWNRYYLRSFQIMLQATRGIVSGSPSFFARAYGHNSDEFEKLLCLPHAFIFHRSYYENGEGQAVRTEYDRLRERISESQAQELIAFLSGSSSSRDEFKQRIRMAATDSTIDPFLRQIIRFHILDTNDQRNEEVALSSSSHLGAELVIPADDTLVEDAGLFDEEFRDEDGNMCEERQAA